MGYVREKIKAAKRAKAKRNPSAEAEVHALLREASVAEQSGQRSRAQLLRTRAANAAYGTPLAAHIRGGNFSYATAHNNRGGGDGSPGPTALASQESAYARAAYGNPRFSTSAKGAKAVSRKKAAKVSLKTCPHCRAKLSKFALEMGTCGSCGLDVVQLRGPVKFARKNRSTRSEIDLSRRVGGSKEFRIKAPPMLRGVPSSALENVEVVASPAGTEGLELYLVDTRANGETIWSPEITNGIRLTAEEIKATLDLLVSWGYPVTLLSVVAVAKNNSTLSVRAKPNQSVPRGMNPVMEIGLDGEEWADYAMSRAGVMAPYYPTGPWRNNPRNNPMTKRLAKKLYLQSGNGPKGRGDGDYVSPMMRGRIEGARQKTFKQGAKWAGASMKDRRRERLQGDIATMSEDDAVRRMFAREGKMIRKNPKLKSLSFGVFPSPSDFAKQFEVHCPDGLYYNLKGSDAFIADQVDIPTTVDRRDAIDEAEAYRIIWKLHDAYQAGYQPAGELASSMLLVCGFEWV